MEFHPEEQSWERQLSCLLRLFLQIVPLCRKRTGKSRDNGWNLLHFSPFGDRI